MSSHLKKHKNDYVQYTNAYTYDEQCIALENDGTWNMDLMDILPLATANIFQVNVKIISSRIDRGVIEIKPSMKLPPLLPVPD